MPRGGNPPKAPQTGPKQSKWRRTAQVQPCKGVRGCTGTTRGILLQKGPNPILSTLRKTRIFGAFSLFSLTPPRKKAESHPWSTVSLSRWCCFSPPIFFLEALTHRLRYGTLLSANKRIFTILKFFTPECTRIKKATHIRTTWLGSNSGGS